MNSFKTPIRFGLIFAAVSIVIDLILYLINPAMMQNTMIRTLVFIASLAIISMAGMRYRDEMGGFIKWKSAMTSMFVCGMIIFITQTLFLLLFNEFIDSSAFESEKEQAIQLIEKMRGMVGAEASDTQIEMITNQKNLDFSRILNLIFGSILISFLIAAIAALFIKRDNPQDRFEKYA